MSKATGDANPFRLVFMIVQQLDGPELQRIPLRFASENQVQ